FQQAGIQTIVTGQQHKISLATIRLLRKELRRGNYDIIYATNSRSIPSAAFAAIGFGSKLVCYRGTTRGLKRRDPTSYLTLLHPRVDAVICVSQSVQQAVEKKLWHKQCQLATIFKGHELGWYQQPATNLGTLGIPGDAFVAIAAARFRPTKGLDILIQATHHLADLAKLHVLVVGSGTDTEQYVQAIAGSPMRERIHVTGLRSDAPQLIAASDVLVQASVDGEGLPRSILEGLAYGTPAISTTAGGAKEILEPGQTGFIVPTRDPQAIADKIRYLYNNREQLEQMASHCRAAIATKLSCAATAEAYENFFASVASNDNDKKN
ncbi:MAG: glycosyltransferase family 4 protein, partial [Pseudomonadales bacterium]|nr:glycosyltransferase family 4 protein [Pseudomonadales bacterium]